MPSDTPLLYCATVGAIASSCIFTPAENLNGFVAVPTFLPELATGRAQLQRCSVSHGDITTRNLVREVSMWHSMEGGAGRQKEG